MTWNIIIYGTDVYAPPSDGTYPLKSTIENQIQVSSVELTVINVNLKPNIEGDNVTYINYSKDFLGTIRYTFEIEFIVQFPFSNINADVLWGLSPFKKRYKYLWLNNYPIKPEKMQNQDRVIPIIITAISTENQNGFKKIRITCEEVNGN